MNISQITSREKPKLTSFERVSEAASFFALPEKFILESGAILRNGRLAIEVWGSLNTARDNTILIFSGMSSGSHLSSSQLDLTPGWWEEAVGVGKSIDTRQYFVVCVSMLGSCLGSSGPASFDTLTKERMGNSFPTLTTKDQARALLPLLQSLKLNQLAAVIGLSMGGSLAKSFASCFNGRIRSLVLVSSALEPSAHAILWRQIQVKYVQEDPNWQAGCYTNERWPRFGMLAARRLGLSTYTGGENLDKLGNDLEKFVSNKCISFVEAFDPLTFVRLIEMQNSVCFNEQLVADIDRIQVIGSSSDILYPPYQQMEVARFFLTQCSHVELNILPSGNGHDMFLREQERVASYVVRGILDADTNIKFGRSNNTRASVSDPKFSTADKIWVGESKSRPTPHQASMRPKQA